MVHYRILGAGRFGRLALARLQGHRERDEFLVVDQNPDTLALLPASPQVQTMAADGISVLEALLEARSWPDWIIPAIPVHVAYEWLRRTLPAAAPWRPASVPDVCRELPFCHRGAAGELYLSLATDRCPDDCSEPAGRCQLTGLPRQHNLYDYLAQQQLPGWQILVLRSRQLAPGVGGYRPRDLLELCQKVAAVAAAVMVCTACRCHGVCHGLQRLTGKEAGVGF